MSKKILLIGMHNIGYAHLVATLLQQKFENVEVVAGLKAREADPIDFAKLQCWVNEHEARKMEYNDNIEAKVREKVRKQKFSMAHLKKMK